MNYPSVRIEGAILSPDLLDRIEDQPGQQPSRFRPRIRRKGQRRNRPRLGRRPGLLAHLPTQARRTQARSACHYRDTPAMDRAAIGLAGLPDRVPAEGSRTQRQDLHYFPPSHEPCPRPIAHRRLPRASRARQKARQRHAPHVGPRLGAGIHQPPRAALRPSDQRPRSPATT